jgi:hypothetical protein
MNKRRIRAAAGDFPKLKGWWMHVEVPGQGESWHHDCGKLRRRDMLTMARTLATTRLIDIKAQKN